MERRPGTPRLLRELNDRAALELLLDRRADDPGAARRADRPVQGHRVAAAGPAGGARPGRRWPGEQAGGRGPNAALYGGRAVQRLRGRAARRARRGQRRGGRRHRPGGHRGRAWTRTARATRSSWCAARSRRRAASAGIVAGRAARVRDRHPRRARPAHRRPAAGGQPARLARGRARRAARRPAAGRSRSRTTSTWPRWPSGRAAPRAGADDFVLVWIGVGLGLATMLGGRLHRGVGGAAGEIGYLPVPGVPLPQDITHPATGAFQSLVGAQALLPLAAGYGFAAPRAQRRGGRARAVARRPAEAGRRARRRGVPRRAGRPGGDRRGRDLRGARPRAGRAGRRGRPGGRDRAGRPGAAEVGRICPARPQVVPDRGERRPGAARRDPGRGRPGPGELLASVADA